MAQTSRARHVQFLHKTNETGKAFNCNARMDAWLERLHNICYGTTEVATISIAGSGLAMYFLLWGHLLF